MVDDDDPESAMWWERGGHTCEGYSSILCVVCVKEHEEALTEKASKRSRGRQCKGCGDDISDRPLNHSVCLNCYRVGEKDEEEDELPEVRFLTRERLNHLAE